MDQRAAVLVEHVAKKPFGRDLSQRRVLVQVADDLSAEDPEGCQRADEWSLGKDLMKPDAR